MHLWDICLRLIQSSSSQNAFWDSEVCWQKVIHMAWKGQCIVCIEMTVKGNHIASSAYAWKWKEVPLHHLHMHGSERKSHCIICIGMEVKVNCIVSPAYACKIKEVTLHHLHRHRSKRSVIVFETKLSPDTFKELFFVFILY